jgi:NAD(P)-dependent dehydrogenase (short-subunit alcohol dehydrogenase family)
LRSAADFIDQEIGRLDILVNNAGISLENRAKAADVDLDIVHKIYDTNVFGVIASTQAMLPLLRKSPNACIVNMSSSLGSLGSLQTQCILVEICAARLQEG